MSGLASEFAARRGAVEAKYAAVLTGQHGGRAVTLAMIAASIVFYFVGVASLDIDWQRTWNGFGELGTIVVLMIPPSPGPYFWLYLDALGQTLSIALLGTLLAAILALPFGFLAARNVVANRILHFLARRSLDTLRSIDVLIWALIWIGVVGLGPFAGILAIATTDVAALAKLFSESIENADAKGEDGVAASGAGPLLRIRFGLLPEALPVMASQVLYFMESNTRSATSLGIVGAGGIGLYINESIRTLDWAKVAFEIILILIAVSLIDVVSSRLRRRLLGAGGQLLQ
jgi:phosphonate transport system permease protein